MYSFRGMDEEQVEVLDVSVGPEVVSAVTMRGAVVGLELMVDEA